MEVLVLIIFNALCIIIVSVNCISLKMIYKKKLFDLTMIMVEQESFQEYKQVRIQWVSRGLNASFGKRQSTAKRPKNYVF